MRKCQGAVPAGVRGWVREGGDVNFDRRPRVDVFQRQKPRRKHTMIQGVRESAGERRVKGFPGAAFAQRRAEVIQKRHDNPGQSEQHMARTVPPL